MAYQLEGSLLEVCTCNILCPCWVGEDPDGGICEGVLAWHFDAGTIDGVDVSGRTFVLLAHIPGNILEGNWRVVAYVDDGATDEQQQVLLDVWTGKLGGPIGDLAQLVGEVIAVEKVPITFKVEGAAGTLKVGDAVEAKLQPFKGATGQSTALHDSIFTTIPGSPAFVGKAENYKVTAPEHGFQIDLHDHNAVQGSFRFAA
ncbi:MAG: DUF1326 domain-containing protein [Actinobacteria bacterium]|nr:MAG: DUF1326 domain-containing protein [Actinomycetota bacterium]TML20990.1 MAG: DUF1326 domain-containing protein [Actinomycetota bacterium]